MPCASIPAGRSDSRLQLQGFSSSGKDLPSVCADCLGSETCSTENGLAVKRSHYSSLAAKSSSTQPRKRTPRHVQERLMLAKPAESWLSSMPLAEPLKGHGNQNQEMLGNFWTRRPSPRSVLAPSWQRSCATSKRNLAAQQIWEALVHKS